MANEDTQSEPPPQAVIEGEGPSSAELFFEEHKKSVIGGIVIAVIAVFAYIVVSNVQKGKQTEAATAFSKSTTIADFAAVTSNYSGTNAAGNALLMKADLEFEENKLNDSRATLEKFVAEYPDHPLYLQGILALGVHEEARGNLDQAQTFYQQVIDAADAAQIAPLALIRKGDVLYARGDYAAARSVYQSVQPTYPGTPFAYKVQEKMNREKLQQAPAPPPVPVPAPQAATPVPVPVPVPVPSSPQPAAPAGPVPTATTKPIKIEIPATPEKPAADKPAPPKNSPATGKPKEAKAKPKATKPAAQEPATEKPEAKPKAKESEPKPKAKDSKPKAKDSEPKPKPAADAPPAPVKPKPAAE